VCFSAGASFGAAVAIGAIGASSVRAAPSRRHLALASIPLLFAAQQVCEGALWLALDRAPYHVGGTSLARAFLFFALFVWPVWVPVSLHLVETSRPRRRALAALAVAGVALGTYLMGCATLRDANACVAFGNLYYWVQIETPIRHVVPFVYLGVVVAPFAISTLRGTGWLALAVATAFVATGLLYRAGFVSVWCFFAALLSGIVALVVRRAPLTASTSGRTS
jgi:hypothetical protein